MVIRVNAIILAAAATAIAVPVAATDLVTNGGFEQPGGAAVRDQLTPGYLPGWTCSDNGTGFEIYEDQTEDNLAAADGTHYVSSATTAPMAVRCRRA